MANENEIQQNQIEDYLIIEKALRHYKKHLNNNFAAVAYISESHETKEIVRENIQAMQRRTDLLITKTVSQINSL